MSMAEFGVPIRLQVESSDDFVERLFDCSKEVTHSSLLLRSEQ